MLISFVILSKKNAPFLQVYSFFGIKYFMDGTLGSNFGDVLKILRSKPRIL